MKSLNTCGNDDVAIRETACSHNRIWVESYHGNLAETDRLIRAIENPHGGLSADLGQCRSWHVDSRSEFQHNAAIDCRSKPHRGRRIDQADLDDIGSCDGISLGRDFAHTSLG